MLEHVILSVTAGSAFHKTTAMFSKLRLFFTMALGVLLVGCNFKGSKPEAAVPTPAPPVQRNFQYRPYGVAGRLPQNPTLQLPYQNRTKSISVSSGARHLPYIALTFDDGPHPVNTPKVLDILSRYNVKATFYVIGNKVGSYPHIIRRIVAEGHEIGNHTWTHSKLTRLSNAQIRSELTRTKNAIIRAAGVKPRTMRPPYGALLTRQRQWIHSEYGYPTILWDVDPQDWKRPGVSVVKQRLVSNARNGSILLLHDLHGPSIQAVPGVLDSLLRKGYKFVTVSQLIAQKERSL